MSEPSEPIEALESEFAKWFASQNLGKSIVINGVDVTRNIREINLIAFNAGFRCGCNYGMETSKDIIRKTFEGIDG